ncbi:MAG: GxxExxY protein [Bacteroidetes bacterium]|nr:GxxExxY protein [Bacteroidota bacterium]
MKKELLYRNEVYDIVNCAIEVHRELGPGFLEAVYQEALEIEFGLQNLPFEREKWLSIYFKGHKLSKRYRADFFCFDKIIVEIKAVSSVPKDTTAQILNYLKGTKCRVGVLLNFGQPKLEFKRYIR